MMREIVHAELLPSGSEALANDPGHWPTEVRGLMELEHEAALSERAPLTVMRIAIDDPDRLPVIATMGGGEGILRALTSFLRSIPRNGDLLALREEDQIVAVLTRTEREDAQRMARQLAEGARRMALPRSSEPIGVRLSIGLAFAQFEVACWFQTLLAVANEGLEVARNAGGGRTVHSELYSLHQRRLERMSPDRPKPLIPPPPAPAKEETAFRPVPTTQGPAAKGPAAKAPAGTAAPPQPAPAASPTSAGLPGLRDLEERVVTLAREWTAEAIAQQIAEQKKSHAGEVEKLERRIQKLTQALEEAHAELERAQGDEVIHPGIASAFRTVQGLRGEKDARRKLEMLTKLVETNLELRALFGRNN